MPGKAGSHDFKFGFEYATITTGSASTARRGRVRYSAPCRAQASPIASASSTSAPVSDFGGGWVTSSNVDQMRVTLQDRWAPNNRLTITAGVRMDNQDAQVRRRHRASRRSPMSLADGTRDLPASTTVDRRHAAQEHRTSPPRLGFSYDLSGKTARRVLKGFYGRYYNNMADGFSQRQPWRDQSYAGTIFNWIVNRNQQAMTAPSGARRAAAAHRRRRRAGRLRTHARHTPRSSADRSSTSSRGESSARLTYVPQDTAPTSSRSTTPARDGVGRAAHRRDDARPRRMDGLQPRGYPASLASQAAPSTPTSRTAISSYDTIEVAFHKRFSSEVLRPDQRRLPEARRAASSADIPDWRLDQPAVGRPRIGIN